MKRVFAMMLVIVMMLGMNALASGEIVGKWMASEIQVQGQSYPINMLGITEATLEFSEDGAGVLVQGHVGGGEALDEFSWQAEGEAYMMKLYDETTEILLEEDSLKMTQAQDVYLIFIREGAADESFVIPEGRTDSTREEFQGNWYPATVYYNGAATQSVLYEKVKNLILVIADDGAGWNNAADMTVKYMTVSEPVEGVITLQGGDSEDSLSLQLNSDGSAVCAIFLKELNDFASVYFMRAE